MCFKLPHHRFTIIHMWHGKIKNEYLGFLHDHPFTDGQLSGSQNLSIFWRFTKVLNVNTPKTRCRVYHVADMHLPPSFHSVSIRCGLLWTCKQVYCFCLKWIISSCFYLVGRCGVHELSIRIHACEHNFVYRSVCAQHFLWGQRVNSSVGFQDPSFLWFEIKLLIGFWLYYLNHNSQPF